MTLAHEMARLERSARYMLGDHGQDSESAEAPVRIHGREPDYGNDYEQGRPLEVRERTFGHGTIHRSATDQEHDGLGGPEFHSDFLRWLTDAGVCMCEGDHRFPCHTVTARFRFSRNKAHPRRLRRAFRQLRDIDPVAYDVLWLLVARGLPFAAVTIRINDERYRRGQEPYSDADLTVFTISGFSILSAAF